MPEPDAPRPEILMFAMGSAGDVHPFAGIGKALRARGHRVTLVANAYFEPVARGANLEFIAAGAAEDYLNVIRDPSLWEARGSYRLMFAKMLEAMRFVYKLASERRDAGPLVIVAPSAALGARIAHEKLGIPLVSMNVETNIFRSAYEYPGREWPERWNWLLPPYRRVIMALMDHLVLDPSLLPQANAFRAQLGLPPVRRIMRDWLHSPQCVIGLFPEWFCASQPDWPPQVRLTGFPLFDEADTRPLEPELRAFIESGEPPIVFTLGTAMRFATTFFESSVEACQLLKRRGILLTEFPEQVPSRLPENVRHFSYAPFTELLPRAAALVHHGGIGTTAQALRAGIPQLLTPMIFDQPHNALRLRRLGVGDSIAPRDYRATRAAQKLDRLLTFAEISRNCREAAGRFHNDQAVARTCDLIEAVCPETALSRRN